MNWLGSTTPSFQELTAALIVGAAALWLLRTPFRSLVLAPASRLLLKQGRVGWAMRLRRWSGTKPPSCH